ncbi:glycoside hydrolase family 16 protein [Streptomyces violaceochromogenes]|uniref:Glycoside hydrolase family 16 protein n=1 Tax=Streptomyces violaceochromogenes TaxID=67377 RepID=A0ABU6LMW6_9ACTN|nr:glycoside hydrolase family 16 protein [Streptomyces violaceochromogenes]MEC7050818.1 glycoside hydrolase family 16 protein [Streptomyces violaceochromogenes]
MRTLLRTRRARAGLAAALTALCAGLVPLAAGSTPASATHVWRTAWADDFNGPAGTLPDSEKWMVDIGTGYPGGPPNWGTGEVQTYTADPANISHDGRGNLRITPLRDTAGRWTSGRIETRRSDFRPPAGGRMRIEARIQLPAVTGAAAEGYWPAFWTLGASYRAGVPSPTSGEFDIMENANGLNRIWGVMHCGTPTGGPCNESTGLAAGTTCPGTRCTGTFHTYTLEWDRRTSTERLHWFVDRRRYHTVSSTQVAPATWQAATAQGHFLLLNLAVGGGFPDALAGHATPTTQTRPGYYMLVDHVAVLTATPHRP